MAFRGGKVFVSWIEGDAGNATARGRDGKVLWQASETIGEATSFWAIAAGKGIVVAAGRDDKGDGSSTMLVVAFNPKTGAGLWLTEAGEAGEENLATAIALGRDAVYVTGLTAPPDGALRMTTRAYATQ